MSGPQRAAIERREAAVAELVRVVMQSTPGHRYATAYGTLSALVTSEDLDPLSWARSFVRQLEEAMQTGLSRARTAALVQTRVAEWVEPYSPTDAEPRA